MIHALFELLVKGKFISWWSGVGIEEDHPLINALLDFAGY